MVELPWRVPRYGAGFFWVVKLALGTAQTYLWNTSNQLFTDGDDVYDPANNRLGVMGDFGNLKDRLTRNSFTLTLLDEDPAWGIRDRLDEVGVENGRLEIKLTDGETPWTARCGSRSWLFEQRHGAGASDRAGVRG